MTPGTTEALDAYAVIGEHAALLGEGAVLVEMGRVAVTPTKLPWGWHSDAGRAVHPVTAIRCEQSYGVGGRGASREAPTML
jgi:hypothetical protein